MLEKLYGKISLRLVFTTTFIITIFMTIGTVSIISYKNGMDLIDDFSDQMLEQTYSRIEQSLPYYLSAPEKIIDNNEYLIKDNIIDINNYNKLEKIFWKQCKLNKNSAFIGISKDKNIIGAERFGKNLLTIRTATEDTDHIFRTYETDNNGKKTKLINSIPFDPRERAWYKSAINAKGKKVWSGIYPDKGGLTSYLGISKAIYKKNKLQTILVTDINLSNINKFLESKKISRNGLALIVEDKTNFMVANSIEGQPIINFDKVNNNPYQIKPSQSENIIISQLGKFIEKNKIDNMLNKHNLAYINGEEYHLLIRKFIYNYGLKWLIIIAIPNSDFTPEIKEGIEYTFYLGIVLLTISVILSIYLSTKITKPLIEISKEMKKISNLDFEKDKKINTVMKEINIINNSLNSMKKGLKSFEKYVPAELVKILIKDNKEATIGFDNAKVSIFFSDIENFTKISEKLPISNLVTMISRYLEELTDIIIKNEGTIDKYIGDSIMAFWNSPQSIDNHTYKIAKASLECIKKVRELKKEWISEGLPDFNTRIGLHIGEVLVGNFGSNKRINYTILGDSVNLASRLEGLNKYYDTNIIISNSLYDEIKDDFLCRPLDIVSVKGKDIPLIIYELISLREDSTDNQSKLVEYYTKALWLYREREFERAINILNDINKNYDDLSSKQLLERCTFLIKNPPNNNWNGIYIFNDK